MTRYTALSVIGAAVALAVLVAFPRPVLAQESEDNGPVISPPPATGGPRTLPGPGSPDESPNAAGTSGTPDQPDDRLPEYWTRGESEVPLPIDHGESEWDESSGSYDIDHLNPLRYIDLAMDWSMTEVNRALNSLIKGLGEPESNRIKLFGRYRFRWEDQNNYDASRGDYDHHAFHHDGWLAGITLTLDVLEFNASMHHVTGRRTNAGEDPYDAHQINVVISGFEGDAIRIPVDFLDTWFRLMAYVGRGPLTFGRGRLIGSDDWDIRGNSFDAAVVGVADSANGGGFSVFAMQAVNYLKRFNSNGHARTLGGVSFIGIDPFGHTRNPDEQFTRVLLRPNEFDTVWFPVVNSRERRLAAGFDIYALWLYENSDKQTGELVGGNVTTGRTDLFTFGLRGGLTWEDALLLEAEFAVQLGGRGGNSVVAFMAHGEATIGIDWALPTAISGIVDIISGDTNPNDGQQQGFDPLFGTRHNRFSPLDYFAPRNLIHYGARVSLQIANSTNLIFSVHVFRSYTSHDGVYGPTVDETRLAADPAAVESSELGVVIAGAFEYHYTPRIHLLAGYSQFFPGNRFSRRGLDTDAILFYLATDLRF